MQATGVRVVWSASLTQVVLNASYRGTSCMKCEVVRVRIDLRYVHTPSRMRIVSAEWNCLCECVYVCGEGGGGGGTADGTLSRPRRLGSSLTTSKKCTSSRECLWTGPQTVDMLIHYIFSVEHCQTSRRSITDESSTMRVWSIKDAPTFVASAFPVYKPLPINRPQRSPTNKSLSCRGPRLAAILDAVRLQVPIVFPRKTCIRRCHE